MTLQSIPLPRSLSILQTHKPNYPLFCQLTLLLFHKHVKPSHLYILILFPFNYASSLYPTTKIRNLGVMLDCSFFLRLCILAQFQDTVNLTSEIPLTFSPCSLTPQLLPEFKLSFLCPYQFFPGSL